MDDARAGGAFYDMQPLVFYVLRGPVVELDQLPAMPQESMFYRSEGEEQLRFSITEANINDQEIINIPSPDQEFTSMMQRIEKFDSFQDFELLRSIDRIKEKQFPNESVDKLKAAQFDPNLFEVAQNSSIKQLDDDLIKDRVKLLLSFSGAAATLIKSCFFEANSPENSIASLLRVNQDIIMPSLKRKLFMDKLQEYYELRNTDMSSTIKLVVNSCIDFYKLGIKNNPDW